MKPRWTLVVASVPRSPGELPAGGRMQRDDLAKPEGLDQSGERAYEAIRKFLKKHDLEYSGGCKVFYSPQEWADRGERYGTNSKLIVCHDGGAHAAAFNLDYEAFRLHDELQQELSAAGLFAEACTCWYTAIYPA